MIDPKTRSLIREIKTKLKSKITGMFEFSSDDAVIDHAIKILYEKLKKEKFLWNPIIPLRFQSLFRKGS